MKKISLYICAALFFACSSSDKAVEKADEIVSADNDTINVTDGSENTTSDAVSGATKTSVENLLLLNGVIEIPPQNYVTISLPINAKIDFIELIEGQSILKDQVIAIISNPDFIELQQQYLDAMVQTEYLEAEYERQKKLSEQDATSLKRMQQSKAEYLSVKSRRDASAMQLKLLNIDVTELQKNGIKSELKINAPISGFATNINVNQGKMLPAGEALCEIVSKGQILLCLTVYEKDFNRLKIGQNIEFKVNGLEENFNAKIVSIGQQVDLQNRSIKIYARSESNNSTFRPGMYVVAKIYK